MFEGRRRGGGARALAGLALCLAAREARGDEGSEASWRVSPFVEAAVADSGQTIDAGVEAYPTAVTSIAGRLLFSVKKGDPLGSSAEVNTEEYDFGVRAQVWTEFGRGARRGALGAEEVRVGSLGIDVGLSFARYEFQPLGYAMQTRLGYSWSAELRGSLFTTLGAPAAVKAATAGEVESGERAAPAPVSYRAWIAEPQARLGYGRRTTAAEDSYLVRPPRADGAQLAERVKLTPPFVVPSLSLLVAVPVAPPDSRFAFGPAARLTLAGAAEGWELASAIGRARLEMWLYYFAIEGATAVRVGVAPYLSARLYGREGRDSLQGGAVIELRESVSRLEY